MKALLCRFDMIIIMQQSGHHKEDLFTKRGVLRYNKEEFHIRHALTVEAVMRYFAKQKGYDEDFWGIVRFIA